MSALRTPAMHNEKELLRDAARLRRAGRRDDAAAACRAVLESHSDHHDALHLLGVIELEAGRAGEAVALLRRAVRAAEATRPTATPARLAEAYNNLGAALDARGQTLKAEWAFRAAVKLKPDYADAFANLGHTLRRAGRPGEAAEALGEALRLRPGAAGVHSALGGACLDLGRFDEAIGHYRRAADLNPDSAVAHSDLLFWLLHDPAVSPQALFDEHRRWAERHERRAARDALPPRELTADDLADGRPLRVGYVSGDFREHTVARFIEPVLASHDPAAVEVHCYNDVRRPDAVTRRLRGLGHAWRDTAGLDDRALAALIRADRIDLLVDLTGHMGGNRLTMFALRPAPVQVSYMGYPHSTGLDAIDWRLTDAESDPPGTTEALHAERLYRLDRCAFAYRPTAAPEVSPLPALARGGRITFGAFNRAAKTNPATARLWARVLDAVPGSRLLVLAVGGDGNAPLQRLLESNGVPADRLALTPTGPRQAYLALAREADVHLDPVPYVGMTTTCDFLWMGLPTVTLAGAGAHARAGASLLRAVGLGELVADTEAQYVAAAARLASDLPRLAALRAALRSRMSASDRRDEAGLTRRLEAAYRCFWRDRCDRRVLGERVAV